MSLGLEYLKNDAVAEPVVPTEGEFSKGLRGGAIGMESQLRSLAGGVGAAMGADEFARGQQAQALELNQQAQAVAPRVGSYKDVGGLRDAWAYGTGLMGQALPSMIPAIAAGGVAALSRGRINPIAAAAAAYAPLETGDVLQRQQLDPVASQRSAGENLGAAALAGGVSSIGQAIVPGMLGSRLAGGTVRAGLRPGGTALGAVGRDALTEGLSEAGGEALKQQGVELGRATDWDAVAEAGVGGAVVGGPLGGVGYAAERLHSVPGGVVNKVREGASSAMDMAKSATQAVSDSTPQAVKDWGDRVNAGLKDATESLTGSISERVAGAKQWHKELMDSPDVPAEIKAQAQSMTDNLGTKANQAWLKAAAAAAKAKGASVELPTTLDDLRGSTVDDDTADRLEAGTPLGDLAQYGARQGQALNDYVKENAKKAADWTMEQGSKLRDKLPQDKLEQLDTVLADAGSAASQAWVATQKKAVDVRDRVSRSLADINSELQSMRSDKDNGIKKSEDMSGFRKMQETLAQELQGKVDPAVLEDNDLTNKLAENLQQFVVAASKEDFFKVQKLADGMRAALGDNTDDVLTRVYQAVGDNNPKSMERYFSNVSRLRQANQQHAALQSIIAEAADPEQNIDVGKVTNVLKKWAAGGDNTAMLGPNTSSFIHAGVRGEIDKMFGAKAPKVYEALQRHADETSVRTAMDSEGSTANAEQDEIDALDMRSGEMGANPINEVSSARRFYGGGKSKAAMESMRDPTIYEAQWGKKDSSAHKLMEKLQAQNPGSEVKFISEAEYNKERGIAKKGEQGRGYVVVEGEQDASALTDKDIDAARLDTAKYAKSPSRLEINGDTIVDALKLTAAMSKKAQATETSDGTPSTVRALNAFLDGAAQLTERYGKFEIPDTTLISKGLTFGQAKAVRLQNAVDQEGDAARRRIDVLRAGYKAAVAEGDDKAKKAILKEANGIVRGMQFMRDSELAADYSSDNTPSLGQMLLEEQGRQASGGDDDIRTAAMTQSPSEMVSRSNMDGSPKFVKDSGTVNTKPLILFASKLADIDTPLSRKIADRVNVLAKGIYSMRVVDQKRLMALVDATKVSEAATVVNELSRKYKDVLVASTETAQEPKIGAVRTQVDKAADVPTRPELDKMLASQDFGANQNTPAFRKAVESRYEELRKLDTRTTEQEAAYKQAARMLKEPAPQATGALEAQLMKRLDYLNNPPADYTTDRATTIKKWAENQITRLDEALKDAPDRMQPDLESARAVARMVVLKAESVLEGDASLGDFEGVPPDPKAVAAKKAAFLEKAASGNKALIAELKASDDAKGLQRAAEALNSQPLTGKQAEVLNVINERLDTLVQDPDVAYNLGTKKYSMASAQAPGTAGMSQQSRMDVLNAIRKVLGNSVSVEFRNLPHAGEFQTIGPDDIIRISTFALNPTSVAYHEALHAFFAKLARAKQTDISKVLEKAAASEHVRKQLDAFFANEPEVLKQINDNAEERAAYMYQLWAGGHITVAPPVASVFQRISNMLREVLGIWSNDQRALHIMEYFHQGQYAANMGSPNAVHRALMEPGRNGAVDALAAMAKPLVRFGDAAASMGSSRLRDTENEHLIAIADLIKVPHTQGGRDQGYIPAARAERSTRLNRLGEALDRFSREELNEALESLQTKVPSTKAEVRSAVVTVSRMLRETLDYMHKAGVSVTDRGPDYFPRVWDSHYISLHQAEFLGMLEKYRRSGDLLGDPQSIMQRLVANDGNDFNVDTRTPGMQHTKARVLSFISDADFAQFGEKDMYKTLNSYISQATRRAEWQRRLGSGKLEALLKKAVDAGATDEQLETTENYIRGVTGTLGDTIDPTARRMMGNMIVYQNIRLLPLAIFSSVVDPLGIAVRGGTMNEAFRAFKRGMREIPRAFKKEAGPKDADTKLAELLGTIDNSTLSHALGSLYTQGMVGGTAQKINDKFFQYNLMEGYNQSMRVAATQAAINFIQRHADVPSAHSARWLTELGLKPADVIVHGDRMLLTEADGLTPEHALRIRTAVNKWVDGAILRPDSADKPIWMNDPRFMLISHLKQFTYSFHSTILTRVMHEAERGNYSPALAMLSYVPVMIAADFMKGMIQGGGEQPAWKKDWTAADYIASGVQRAGLLGVGQFGADVLTSSQRSGGLGLGALAGPTLEQSADALEVAGGQARFGAAFLDAMPANALYKEAFAASAGRVVGEGA